jgi:hypothetical protein
MLLRNIIPAVLLASSGAHSNPLDPGTKKYLADKRDGLYERAEIVRFKRDAPLEARDLELAELHQVNLTESEWNACSLLQIFSLIMSVSF